MAEQNPKDLETIDLSVPTTETKVPIENHNKWGSVVEKLGANAMALVMVAGVAFEVAWIEAAIHDGNANDKVTGKTEQPSTTTTTTIAPNLSNIKPDYSGSVCYSQDRTIKPGDTVFGLTTVGLEKNDYFKNAVFGWNLNYIKEQSQKDPALSDPNNIPIGHKLRIQTDCLDLRPVRPVRDWENFDNNDSNSQPSISHYKRHVTYQSYTGTDNKKHNDVAVNYVTDEQGSFKEVEYCEPAPDCYNYVAGAPEQPPEWQWTP